MSGPKPKPSAMGWGVERRGGTGVGLGRGNLKISGRALNSFLHPAIPFLEILRILRDMVRGRKVNANVVCDSRRKKKETNCPTMGDVFSDQTRNLASTCRALDLFLSVFHVLMHGMLTAICGQRHDYY